MFSRSHFILYSILNKHGTNLFALKIFCWPNWYYIYCWFSIAVLVCVSKLQVYMYHLNILKRGYCSDDVCAWFEVSLCQNVPSLFCINISTQTTAKIQAFGFNRTTHEHTRLTSTHTNQALLSINADNLRKVSDSTKIFPLRQLSHAVAIAILYGWGLLWESCHTNSHDMVSMK